MKIVWYAGKYVYLLIEIQTKLVNWKNTIWLYGPPCFRKILYTDRKILNPFKDRQYWIE